MSWEEKDGKLVFERAFADFSDAMAFVNKVAELAEAEQHHPDLHLESYSHVRLELYTHSEGRVSEKDRELAAKIDRLL